MVFSGVGLCMLHISNTVVLQQKFKVNRALCKHVGPAPVGSTLCLQTHHQNTSTWRSPSAWLFRKYTAAHRYSAEPYHLSIDGNIRPEAPSDATQAATTFAPRTSVRLARMRWPDRSGESRRNRSPLSFACTIATDSQKEK